MNERISFGKNPPSTFQESLRFDRDCPYRIRCKDLASDDLAPPHYAQTLEVMICCDARGEIVIDGKKIQVCGDSVIVVPPRAVHSVSIRSGRGKLYVLQISFEALRAVVDVEALLARNGLSFTGMEYVCPAFHQVYGLLREMIERDGEPFVCVCALMGILRLFLRQMKACAPQEEGHAGGNESLRRVLRWTENNLDQEIHLEDAAEVAGFAKNYFCTWFKANTGVTYNRYLNDVRVSNACRLLARSGSVSSACYDSGFRDMSYFIQRFKRARGCTPRDYLRRLK